MSTPKKIVAKGKQSEIPYDVKTKDLVKALKKLGFEYSKAGSNHEIWKNAHNQIFPVPRHKITKTSTIKDTLKRLDIPVNKFMNVFSSSVVMDKISTVISAYHDVLTISKRVLRIEDGKIMRGDEQLGEIIEDFRSDYPPSIVVKLINGSKKRFEINIEKLPKKIFNFIKDNIDIWDQGEDEVLSSVKIKIHKDSESKISSLIDSKNIRIAGDIFQSDDYDKDSNIVKFYQKVKLPSDRIGYLVYKFDKNERINFGAEHVEYIILREEKKYPSSNELKPSDMDNFFH